MDDETRLREAVLPEVSVKVERALEATTRRGRARRRRSKVILAAGAVVVVAGLALGAFRLLAEDPTTNLATVPSGGPADPSSQPEPGDVAVWDVDPTAPPSKDASSFTAMVTRLGCNGGVTGTVLRPGVLVSDDTITVTFAVEPAEPGGHTCQGNDAVPYVVDLGQPIGGRILVDGACAEGQEAATTSFCADSAGVRWRGDGGDIHAGDFSVSGRMVSVGGPPGAGPDPAPGTVRAVDPAGATIATADTDANGNFELALPNGTYRLVGRSPLYQSGSADCLATTEVVVHDRFVEGVSVECQRR
jgi:hypothetical protein